MLPTQGPAVPVTSRTFSSSVSWETNSLACSKAASQSWPVAFAETVFVSSVLTDNRQTTPTRRVNGRTRDIVGLDPKRPSCRRILSTGALRYHKREEAGSKNASLRHLVGSPQRCAYPANSMACANIRGTILDFITLYSITYLPLPEIPTVDLNLPRDIVAGDELRYLVIASPPLRHTLRRISIDRRRGAGCVCRTESRVTCAVVAFESCTGNAASVAMCDR